MSAMHTNNTLLFPRSRRVRRGFTLIELLVTIAVIVILLGILIVAFGAVRTTARGTITNRLIANVTQAIDRFEEDTGYLPPLLVPNNPGYAHVTAEPTNRVETIVPEAQSDPRTALRNARYKSDYTLTAYLLGTGDINGDAPGDEDIFPNRDEDDGVAGPGIRNPGPDKSWGGARDRDDHDATEVGRVLGPYLDAGSLGDALRIDPQTGLYRLFDAFDSPIRYYRYWPTTEVEDGARQQTLDQVPLELLDDQSVINAVEFGDPLRLSDNRDVLSFEYMVVSAGAQPRTEVIVSETGDPLEQFGDILLNETDFATTYTAPSTETSSYIDVLSMDEALWKGTKPMITTNIKVGR
jgi:prepilin-type N-terminal cleavage/methylation domain-containing protein